MRLLQILVLSILVASCANLKRHQNTNSEGGKEPKTDSPAVESQDQSLPPPPKELKLGVILGPGYLRGFAHLGVLSELENQKVPVSAISGIGWGAIFAGGFAIDARVSNLEWQMFKLTKSELPEKSLFSSKPSPVEAGKLETTLNRVFKSGRIQNTSVPFFCPATNLRGLESRLIERGSLKDEVKRCFSGNSFYKPYREWMWDPFAYEEIIEKFKQMGIDKILLVDVLDPRGLRKARESMPGDMDYFVWGKTERMQSKASTRVDYYIQVSFDSKDDLNQFDHIRDYTRKGKRSAKNVVNRISREVLGR